MTKNQKKIPEENNYDGIEDEYVTEFHDEPEDLGISMCEINEPKTYSRSKKEIIYPKRRFL